MTVGGEETLWVDDLFSAFTYTGNGSTQTITNGIDLAGKGGLVWSKSRSAATSHILIDSVRGGTNRLITNSDGASITGGIISSFNADGYTMTGTPGQEPNVSAATYVSWTFRKAPKFFDVVTYTGNATNRTISHSLGQEVGMMIVKRTDTPGDWQVYHRTLGNGIHMVLNSTGLLVSGSNRWNSTSPTTTVFSLGTDTTVNASGGSYVAYIFAHDSSADGLIQCGLYVGNASASGPTITLGWEPQFVMVKAAWSFSGNWNIFDSMRGLTVGGTNDAYLEANTSDAEASADWITPTATGFQITSASGEVNANLGEMVYLAIRRPNKPPTVGTQVYNAIARTGTGAAATITGVGFAPDLVAIKSRSAATENLFCDRLRGTASQLVSNTTAAQSTSTNIVTAYGMDGVSLGSDGFINHNNNGNTYINHFFKRAPGVFDICCFSATGSNLTVTHGLGAVPEMMIVKARSSAGWNWAVYEASQGATKRGLLNLTNTFAGPSLMWNSTAPTLTTFTVGAGDDSNPSAGVTMVAYLFASKAGISKVFSFTGNGTNQNIECGFTTGARFVLLKRTDSAGNWLVADTVRGLVSGNDPSLALNSTAAEVTTLDWIDPYSGGFNIVQEGTNNANVNAATYIGLAFS